MRNAGGRPPKDASRVIQRAVRENRLDGRNRWVQLRNRTSSALLTHYALVGDFAAQIVADRVSFKLIIVTSQEGRVIRDGGPVIENGDLHLALRKNGYGTYTAAITRDIALLEEMSAKRAAKGGTSLEDYLRQRTPASAQAPTTSDQPPMQPEASPAPAAPAMTAIRVPQP